MPTADEYNFNNSRQQQETKTGKVSWYNAFRGFGFITIDDGSGDVYVHQSNIDMEGFRKLEDGASVQFKIGIDDSERGGGKAYAFDVISLDSDGDDESTQEVQSVDEETEEAAEAEEVNAPVGVKEEVVSNLEEPEPIAAVEVEAKEAEEAEEVSEPVVKEEVVSDIEQPEPTLAAEEPAVITDDSMDEGEKAFNILVGLGMVEMTPDPDDASYDNSKDDELAPHTEI
eukprot:CAMPEP_0197715058 /NCGR_PEP_ID=MMETSP1434-20131217/217_1 /TAXON_ID=265543 /ORGANISM="Minutocellus polymorphus, Strain CCMP3303" /LENGTH=227 /DNA_ID=CAMNT_0043299045 /DNA_START=222 /DNA_END=906 /DNA_ORIENTATION=+